MRSIVRHVGNGAEPKDMAVRTVLFAFASLAAWWCCTNAAASADEAQPEPQPAANPAPDSATAQVVAPAAPADGSPTEAMPAPAQVAAERGAGSATEIVGAAIRSAPDAGELTDDAAAEAGPVLFPVVVAPLVDAVTPAVAPAGDAVFPLVDAVTTPASPVLRGVVPMADKVVGPVVAPAAQPAVDFVRPVVEQVATTAAPVVRLVAPAVVPVARPVAGVVTPVVGQVVASVAQPLAGATTPALRSVLELDPRYLGLRPATADVPADRGPGSGAGTTGLPIVPTSLVPDGDATPAALQGADRGIASDHDGRDRDSDADGDAESGAAQDLAPARAATDAPAPAPQPFGAPFRGMLPPAPVLTQGSADGGARETRRVAVLPPSAGTPEVPTAALGRIPVVSALARFGGRAPVTPD
jgi:hypothetical protein